MIKMLCKIIAVIGLIILAVSVLIKMMPWVVAALAVAGAVIELHHLWRRSRGDAGSAELV